MKLYSSVEICRLTGCSYRQLTYWRMTGKIVPHHVPRGSGDGCEWNPEQLERITHMLATLAEVDRLLASIGMSRGPVLAAKPNRQRTLERVRA